MVAAASKILREPSLDFKTQLDSIDFMTETLQQLKIKKDIEGYKELKQTINFFNGIAAEEKIHPAFNHPIDWEIITDLSPASEARIQTRHGTVILELLRIVAPGSVANFVQLARNGFYDNKNFHRVVSNFVIQGGCSRGDGYGSLDYTIRSELPPVYYDAEGYVGMASAGNHTECTQWFITHSPSPHLNGKLYYFCKGEKRDGCRP